MAASSPLTFTASRRTDLYMQQQTQHGFCAVQGMKSQWQLLVDSLPKQVDTPVLWPPTEQADLLQGSAALQEAQSRLQALDAEWQSIAKQLQQQQQSNGQGMPQRTMMQMTCIRSLSITQANVELSACCVLISTYSPGSAALLHLQQLLAHMPPR